MSWFNGVTIEDPTAHAVVIGGPVATWFAEECVDRVAPVGNGRYSKQCVFDPAMRRVFRRSCFLMIEPGTWHSAACARPYAHDFVGFGAALAKDSLLPSRPANPSRQLLQNTHCSACQISVRLQDLCNRSCLLHYFGSNLLEGLDRSRRRIQMRTTPHASAGGLED
jgi:hypothetical protein